MVLIAQAFLSIVVIIRLSNIVIRRMYLACMAAAIDPEGPTDMAQDQRVFWQCMAVNGGQLADTSRTRGDVLLHAVAAARVSAHPRSLGSSCAATCFHTCANGGSVSRDEGTVG